MALKDSESTDTLSTRDTKKELRRVYRKLKGVRKKLSVKMRELKKEIKDTRTSVEDDDADLLEETEDHDETEEGSSKQLYEKPATRSIASTQYEVKSLADHKTRLRKQFWRLQEKARRGE